MENKMAEKRPQELNEGFAKSWQDNFYIHSQIIDLWHTIRKFGCPAIYEGDIGYGEREKIKRIDIPLDKWVEQVRKARDLYRRLSGAREYIEHALSEVNDITLALNNTYPAEYDQKMFEKGFVYMANLKGVHHWSIPVLNEKQMLEFKDSYEKCQLLFSELTEGLKTHNFHIIHAMEGDYASFGFTCEGVPGELELTFPTIKENFLVQEGFSRVDAMRDSLPMQMCIGWRFHDAIPVIDKFFCHTYHLQELKDGLRGFVDSEGWRNMLHKEFVCGHNDDGSEIVTKEMPEFCRASQKPQ